MNPTLWKMVEGVCRKADVDTLHQVIRDSIQETLAHADNYKTELSCKAAGK